jgi:hypothetical protein
VQKGELGFELPAHLMERAVAVAVADGGQNALPKTLHRRLHLMTFPKHSPVMNLPRGAEDAAGDRMKVAVLNLRYALR